MLDAPKNAAVASKDAVAWFTPGKFALLLALIIAVMFPKVITGQECFFYRDFGLFTHPVAQFQRESFWRGEIPLWNPYNNFGIPFLAQWNTSTLYPPSLFYLVLPLPWSLAVFNLAHLLFAGLGMFLLARRWTGNPMAASVAGLAFAFNGLSWHMLMWVSNLAAYTWMPWVVLAAEAAWQRGGRRVLLAALAGAMQMLSGAPEIILLTWLVVGALWLGRLRGTEQPRARLFGRLAVVISLVAGLSAVQLLPFVDLLTHGNRDATFDTSAWAMPAWGWANFVVPLFHCSPSILGVYSQNDQQWASSYYAGIGVLALAALALGPRRDWRIYMFAVAALGGLLLSMGDHGLLLPGLKKLFPGVGVMRYPIKMIVLTNFALPLLAAFGLQGMLDAGQTVPRTLRMRLLAVGVVLLLVLAGILVSAQRFPMAGDKWPVTLESGVSRAIFLILILGGAWTMSKAISTRVRGLAGLAVLLLIAVDAMTHTSNQNPTVPIAAYGPLGIEKEVSARHGEARAMLDPRLQTFLLQASVPDRFAYFTGVRSALFLNCNLPEKIPVTSGFFSLYLRDAHKVETLLNNSPGGVPKPLADFLGASWISSAEMPLSWTNRSNHLPLVTAGQRPVFAAPAETLKALGSATFDPRSTVYLPPEARATVTMTNTSTPSLARQQFAAHQISFEAQASEPALIVVAQSFYHSWRAYVDGKRTPLWQANYAFQALRVPAGRHDVELVYVDPVFEYGAAISLLTLALCGGIWLRWRNPTRS